MRDAERKREQEREVDKGKSSLTSLSGPLSVTLPLLVRLLCKPGLRHTHTEIIRQIDRCRSSKYE